uniref:Uncharacterized protein n=1 Tax=Meloidogyne incognita TaxID=6306 RepID=A0A914KKT8_MELIC
MRDPDFKICGFSVTSLKENSISNGRSSNISERSLSICSELNSRIMFQRGGRNRAYEESNKNPKLMQHFLQPGTDLPISNLKTGLCIEQTVNLQAQVLKAKENGTLPFNVEFRYFDYKEWYPELWNNREDEATKLVGDEELPKRNVSVDDVYQNPDIVFPIHNRDVNTKWDEWWMRQEKFTRKGR